VRGRQFVLHQRKLKESLVNGIARGSGVLLARQVSKHLELFAHIFERCVVAESSVLPGVERGILKCSVPPVKCRVGR
jgi:hypothetical protein